VFLFDGVTKNINQTDGLQGCGYLCKEAGPTQLYVCNGELFEPIWTTIEKGLGFSMWWSGVFLDHLDSILSI